MTGVAGLIRERLVRLQLDSTEGVLHQVLLRARLKTRIDLLDELTTVEDYDRGFRRGPGVRVLEKAEHEIATRAFESCLDTIPENKRFGSIGYFTNEGHRTAVSQRALQAHADPWLGYTEIDGPGSSSRSSRRTSTTCHREDALCIRFGLRADPRRFPERSGHRRGDRRPRVGMAYAEQSRHDHRLFVDAFRGGKIPAVRPAAEG